MQKSEMTALKQLKSMKGTFRTSEALKLGIHPRTLYALRDNHYMAQISRGVYRLATHKAITNPDLVTVASRTPNAIICLISALSFHKITTQIPHAVEIAIERNSKAPRVNYPPIVVHKFSSEAFSAGIETHQIDDVAVQIYSMEKTLVDCFKYRNKIGLDVCIEALKLYKARKKIKILDIIKYATICNVKKIMTPYLESIF